MTRTDCIETVYTMDELFEAYEENLPGTIRDTVILKGELDDRIDDDLRYALDMYSWRDILAYLDNICDDDSDFYVNDGLFSYQPIEDGGYEFDCLKEEFIEMMDNNGYWDDEDPEDIEEDEDSYHEEAEEQGVEVFQTAISFTEFFVPMEYNCSEPEIKKSVPDSEPESHKSVKLCDVEELLF